MTDEQTVFGAGLRVAREARGVSLRRIADATKLSVRTLEALERGQLERLPGGIYRRNIVRSYAREIGLDPEATLREFLTRHPDDLPPPKVEPGSRGHATAPPVPPKRGMVLRLGSLLVPWLTTR
jgi:cytoskeleton protein RodZ